MKTITIRQHPELALLIKRVLPGYRKHKALITAQTQVTCSGTYWDGGSRSEYFRAFIAGGPARSIGCPSAPSQFGGGPAPKVDIEPGMVVLSTGVFCGRTATLSIWVHPDDAEALTAEVAA